jgi:hypothetical protein
MLNLNVTLRLFREDLSRCLMRWIIALTLLLLAVMVFIPPRVLAQEGDILTPTLTPRPTFTPAPPPQPQNTHPKGGEANQGPVTNTGSSGIPGFFFYELYIC